MNTTILNTRNLTLTVLSLRQGMGFAQFGNDFDGV